MHCCFFANSSCCTAVLPHCSQRVLYYCITALPISCAAHMTCMKVSCVVSARIMHEVYHAYQSEAVASIGSVEAVSPPGLHSCLESRPLPAITVSASMHSQGSFALRSCGAAESASQCELSIVLSHDRLSAAVSQYLLRMSVLPRSCRVATA